MVMVFVHYSIGLTKNFFFRPQLHLIASKSTSNDPWHPNIFRKGLPKLNSQLPHIEHPIAILLATAVHLVVLIWLIFFFRISANFCDEFFARNLLALLEYHIHEDALEELLEAVFEKFTCALDVVQAPRALVSLPAFVLDRRRDLTHTFNKTLQFGLLNGRFELFLKNLWQKVREKQQQLSCPDQPLVIVCDPLVRTLRYQICEVLGLHVIRIAAN